MAVAASRGTAAISATVPIWAAALSPIAASKRIISAEPAILADTATFAFHDRNRLLFGDDDYDPEQCQPEWLNQYGHRVLVEVCS
ncbi:hypothetical protein [Rhizobium ruizarguesonis]|uniref:hypothetical protein n=1 Tax=Rhizobium ruizarguesonis TaxID=2081791 RepID=UPI001FED99DD|nr:hypothetical protein [Rhizobium ruizarguesonis]